MKTLSRSDVRLTLQFLPLLAEVRWKLWRTPFSRLHAQWQTRVQSELNQAVLPAIGPFASPPTPAERALIDAVWNDAHAVRRAARLVPRASCLTQAMTLQLALARRGQPCSVRIGVDRAPAASTLNVPNSSDEIKADSPALQSGVGRFEAHAWVEWQGRVVLGGDVRRWKPLTIFAPAVFSRDIAALGDG